MVCASMRYAFTLCTTKPVNVWKSTVMSSWWGSAVAGLDWSTIYAKLPKHVVALYPCLPMRFLQVLAFLQAYLWHFPISTATGLKSYRNVAASQPEALARITWGLSQRFPDGSELTLGVWSCKFGSISHIPSQQGYSQYLGCKGG